jgi:hypothetical protein
MCWVPRAQGSWSVSVAMVVICDVFMLLRTGSRRGLLAMLAIVVVLVVTA